MHRMEQRKKTALICSDKSRTKQSFKGECDINNIMKQFERTGLVGHTNSMHPTYGDFTNVVDYKTACDQVANAMEDFLALPVRIRNRFRNDPAELIAFLADPNNRDEAIELDLVVDMSEPEPAGNPSPTAEPVPAAAGDSGA